MKHVKTVFFFGLMCLSLQAWAQPMKGSVMVGGTAGFNSYKYDEFKSTTIHLNPFAGFFIMDQLAVGASVTAVFFGGDDEGSSLGIGPFARYYFNNSGDARFFGQAGIDYSSFDPGDNFDSSSNFGFNVGAGVDYFLNEHVALEAVLGFSSDKEEDDDESATNIGLNIGISAFIGGGN